MIKINLLPTEQGKKATAGPRAAGPSPAPFYVAIFLLIGMAGAAGYYVYSLSADAARQITEATAKRDKLKKEVQDRQKKFEAMNLLSLEIEEKYAVVEALGPQNRIFWSEKINMIAMARLNLAVYITKLALEEQIDEQETAESVQRREAWKREKETNPKLQTQEPKPVKQPVINQTLVIDAIAYGNDAPQRLRQINSFLENLRSFQWKRDSGEVARFVDRMTPEFEQLPHKVDKVGGVDIIRFGFRIKADPQLDRTVPTAANTAAGAPGATAPAAPAGQEA